MRAIISCILICIFLPIPKVHATFGLGPCCSGFTCGIIPCDASCGGRAITTMGTSFASNIQQINTTSTQLTNSANNNKQPLTDYYSKLGSSLQNRVKAFLSGLDALTIKFEATKSQEIEAWQALGDNLANQVNYAIRTHVKTTNIITNSSDFGETSQPTLFEAITNHSKGYIEALAERKSRQNELLTMHKGTKDVVASAQRDSVKTKIEDELSKWFVPLYPLNTASTEYEAQDALIISDAILADSQLKTSAHMISNLLSESGSENNKPSATQLINNVVLSGVIDSQMILETNLLNKQGLNRQITVQQQITSMLEQQLLEKRVIRNRLLTEQMIKGRQ